LNWSTSITASFCSACLLPYHCLLCAYFTCLLLVCFLRTYFTWLLLVSCLLPTCYMLLVVCFCFLRLSCLILLAYLLLPLSPTCLHVLVHVPNSYSTVSPHVCLLWASSITSYLVLPLTCLCKR
jgi:hypothetical protein